MNTLQDTYTEYAREYAIVVKKNNNANISAFFREINSDKATDIKYMFTTIGTVAAGDNITIDGVNYIIISKPLNINGVYDKSIIRQCKNIIKFVIGGVIGEFPSLIDSFVSTVTEGQYISEVEGKLLVTLQDNQYSKQIKVNDRFIKNDNAYKIIGIDNLSKIGLIILTAEKDAVVAGDDLSNEIANADRLSHYTINITNGDTANSDINKTLQLLVEVKNNNTVVTEPVTYVSNDANICTVDGNGLITAIAKGNCSISAILQRDNSIFDTIDIVVNEVVIDNFTYTFTPVMTTEAIYLNESKTYTIKKFNNGVEVTGITFTYKIINVDNSANIYVTITGSTSNTVTIKASSNTSYAGKYIKVQCLENDNVVAEKQIKIKSVF